MTTLRAILITLAAIVGLACATAVVVVMSGVSVDVVTITTVNVKGK